MSLASTRGCKLKPSKATGAVAMSLASPQGCKLKPYKVKLKEAEAPPPIIAEKQAASRKTWTSC